MRWLVTGGCGFIGRNLISRLIQDDENQIVVFDDLSVGKKEELSEICEFQEEQLSNSCVFEKLNKSTKIALVEGTILDQLAAIDVSNGADVIVHLAANTGVGNSIENPRSDMEMNVLGSFNMLEAARVNSIKRFIFASSGAPAGEVTPPIHEELAPHPISPYGASKLAGEGYCSAYAKSYFIDTVCLRFSNVYGPYSGHKTSVVAKFLLKATENRPLEVYSDGEQTRDFIFVSDLIDAIIVAARAEGIGGEVFQIATENETSIKQLIELMKFLFNEKGMSFPEHKFSQQRVGDVRRNFSDTAKAKHLLGWQARTSLEVGMRETLNWFLMQGKIEK